jgi:hypothetical protein
MADREMPKYECHKKVWAFGIKRFTRNNRGEITGFTPADAGYGDVVLSQEYIEKHKPVEGGYYVVYPDGYKSFSPASAFEGGYRRIN